MGELKFNEEERFRGIPSYYKRESELLKLLRSMGLGDKIAAKTLIFGAIIFIFLSFIFLYNLVTTNFEPAEIPDIENISEQL